MSKERELLEKIISGDNKGDFFISYDLYKEIHEFLAQPEQENLELVRKLGFEAGYLLAIKECSKTLSAYLG